MPTNIRVCAGFRSASRVVSESGRDGSATAIVAAVELLVLSKAFAPETSVPTAIKTAAFFISILLSLRLKHKRRHLDLAACNVSCCAANADRGQHAVALARCRLDITS